MAIIVGLATTAFTEPRRSMKTPRRRALDGDETCHDATRQGDVTAVFICSRKDAFESCPFELTFDGGWDGRRGRHKKVPYLSVRIGIPMMLRSR